MFDTPIELRGDAAGKGQAQRLIFKVVSPDGVVGVLVTTSTELRQHGHARPADGGAMLALPLLDSNSAQPLTPRAL
eukprot:3421572-Prymnesium_polylepis.1